MTRRSSEAALAPGPARSSDAARSPDPARVEDVHELAMGMPHVKVEHGGGENPVYQVGGKSFVFFRAPRPDAVDPSTGERYQDVIIFWVGSEADKQALVGDTASPFFTTPHFDGHLSVLVQASRLAELPYAELAEVVQDAWLARASPRRAAAWLATATAPPTTPPSAPSAPVISAEIVAEVEAEVARAHAKHGARSILNPAMPDAVRLPVLVEEVGEVAKAMLENADPAELRAELIQVAAVALTWLEALRTSDGAGRLRYRPANKPPYQETGPPRDQLTQPRPRRRSRPAL